MRAYLVTAEEEGWTEARYVEARCPREAVEQMAPDVVPGDKYFKPIRVMTLLSGERLASSLAKVTTYFVHFERRVSHVFKDRP